jgi:hypothetical protein
MKSRRRPLLWLLAAVGLLLLAALLKHTSETSPEVSSHPDPEFPREMRPAEVTRMTAREVLPKTGNAGRHRDPILSALSAPDAGTAVVFEANALRHSPIGLLLLDCVASSMGDSDGGRSPLDEIRGLGWDPLQDLDRIAIGDDSVALSGDFSRVHWDTSVGVGDGAEAYGTSSQIRTFAQAPDGGVPSVLSIWSNQLVIISPTREAAMATLDRVEGRTPTGQLLSDNQAYGDVYGVLSGNVLEKMLDEADSPLAAQIQDAVRSVELHLDATRDVGLVATLSGDNESQLTDLGKALGGALALARTKAALTGDTVTAELLDYAEVTPRGSKVNLEMALPFAVLQKMLAFCRTATTDAGR